MLTVEVSPAEHLMSQVKEVRSLTGLRGLAAVYVMLFHYWIGISTRTALGRVLAHGYLSVDLFFVLSGFVLALNYSELFRAGASWRSFRVFLGRRIARVYPLYFVASLCGLLLSLLHWAPGLSSEHPLGDIAANFAMVQAWGVSTSLDGAAWSVSAEWAAYLLFPVVLWAAYHPETARTKSVLCLAFLSIAGLCLLPAYIVHRPGPTALLDLHVSYHCWPVLRCLPEFAIGVVFARACCENAGRWLAQYRYATGIAVLFLFTLLGINKSDFFVVALCPVLILALTVEGSLTSRVLSSSFIHHLGLLSYSIYLVHELLGGLIEWVHREVNARGYGHGQSYAAVLAILLVYPCSLAAYTFVEKPGRRFLRSHFESPSASAQPSAVGPLGVETSEI